MTDRTMRAKLVVHSVTKHTDTEGKVTGLTVSMGGVSRSSAYPADGSDEDNSFARWSPSISLSMFIANPALFDKIHVGQKFYNDFTEAPDSPAAPAA
jgi:hypothetical protein